MGRNSVARVFLDELVRRLWGWQSSDSVVEVLFPFSLPGVFVLRSARQVGGERFWESSGRKAVRTVSRLVDKGVFTSHDFVVFPYAGRVRDKYLGSGRVFGVVVAARLNHASPEDYLARVRRFSWIEVSDARVVDDLGDKYLVFRLDAGVCWRDAAGYAECARGAAKFLAEALHLAYREYVLAEAQRFVDKGLKALWLPMGLVVVDPALIPEKTVTTTQLIWDLALSVASLARVRMLEEEESLVGPVVFLDDKGLPAATSAELAKEFAARLQKLGYNVKAQGEGVKAYLFSKDVATNVLHAKLRESYRKHGNPGLLYVKPLRILAEWAWRNVRGVFAGAPNATAPTAWVLSIKDFDKVVEEALDKVKPILAVPRVRARTLEPAKRPLHDVGITVAAETGGHYELATTERLGSPTVAGLYSHKTKTIYIRRRGGKEKGSTLSTLIHEVAHHIDDYLGGREGTGLFSKQLSKDPRFIEEAQKLLVAFHYYTDDEHTTSPSELFAEAFELYVLYPNTVRKISPYMYRLMRGVFRRLPPETRRVLREASLGSYKSAVRALEALEERGLLQDLPWELRKAAGKPVGQLTEEEKQMLLRWALVKYGPRFLRDISRRARHRPRYTYTWIKAPNRTDIPGVDTPEVKPTYKKMLEKRKKALRAG